MPDRVSSERGSEAGATAAVSAASSRPSSRQRKSKRGGGGGENKNPGLSHISGSDQLLPSFYENVATIQNRQKLLGECWLG